MAPSGKKFTPWVCCTRCQRASWVYVHWNVTNCRRCGDRFPEPWPPLPGRGGGGNGSGRSGAAGSAKASPDVWASLLDKLDGDLPPEVKVQVKAAIDKQSPAKRPAAVTHVASQRLQVALKKRDQHKDKLKKARASVTALYERIRDAAQLVADLLAESGDIEKEVLEASEAARTAIRKAACGEAAPVSPVCAEPVSEQGQRIEDLRQQLEQMRKDNEELRALLLATGGVPPKAKDKQEEAPLQPKAKAEAAKSEPPPPVPTPPGETLTDDGPEPMEVTSDTKEKNKDRADGQLPDPKRAKPLHGQVPAKSEKEGDKEDLDNLSPEQLLSRAAALANSVAGEEEVDSQLADL